MKRISLVSLLLLTILFTSAQSVHFGLTLAPGVAWLKPQNKGIEGNGSKIGFSYGIITEFGINKAGNYAFSTGLNVTYRGGKISKDSIESNIKLKYLELPLSLKMKTNEIGNIKYFGQFGIVPAVNLKADVDSSYNDYSSSTSFKSRTQPFNASLLIALGLEYNFSGSTSGFVSIGFNNGLLDLLKSGEANAISNFMALNLGLFF